MPPTGLSAADRTRSAWTEHLPALVLFVSALLVRLCYVHSVSPRISLRWLPERLDSFALLLVSGGKHSNLTGWASFHLFLAPLYKALQTAGLLEYRYEAVALVNAFLGALSVMLFYLLALAVFPGRRRLSFALSLAYLLYYPAIYFTAVILSENLFIPLFIGLLLGLAAANGDSGPRAMLLGLLFGICLVIRPLIMPFLPLLLIWLYFTRWRRSPRGRLLFLGAFFAGLFFVAGSAALVNSRYHAHGRLSFADNGGVNFALAWCKPHKITYKLADGETNWFSPPYYWDRPPETDIVTDVPFHRQSYYYRLGLRCMSKNPGYLLSNLYNVRNLFSSRFYPDLLTGPTHNRLLFFWKLSAVVLLFGFLLFPLFFENGKWGLGALVLLSLAAAVYAGNPGEERYLVPYYFVLLLWGAPGAVEAAVQAAGRAAPGVSKDSARQTAAVTGIALLAAASMLRPDTAAHRRAQAVFRSHLTESFHQAARWLAVNQRSDGRFIYGLKTDTQEELPGDNITRQLLTSQGLVNAVKFFPEDRELYAAYQRNLRFIKSLIKRDGHLAFVQPAASRPMIGETVFAILTLIDSPEAERFHDEIADLGEFILRMQKDDGSLNMLYPPGSDARLSAADLFNLERFASGEALLACVEVYKALDDPRYLDCARRGFQHYVPLITQRFHPSFVSWHTIAYARLYQIERRREYLEAVNILADELVKLQITQAVPGKPRGSFDARAKWWSSAEAVFTEALGLASRVNYRTDYDRAMKYRRANRLALSALISLQFEKNAALRLRGGIKSDFDIEKIYLDNNGHALMAFVEFLSRPE